MTRKRILKPIVIFLLVIGVMLSTLSVATFSEKESTTVEAEIDFESLTKTVFDKALKLVVNKGKGMINKYVPVVGDYVANQIFDYFGIDHTSSYEKELKAIHTALDEIQKELQDLVAKETKEQSRIVIRNFLNIVDTFSLTVQPIYSGYCKLIRIESDDSITKEEKVQEEKEFYENNLKTLMFGSGTSTGSLYLQLVTLLKAIVTPDATLTHQNLMDHYTITYEHLWPFETFSFKPKKEFLGYVTTIVIEGLALYTFQNTYEQSIANDTTKARLEGEWNGVESVASNALEYLAAAITKADAIEQKSIDGNYVYHYATGTKLSKKLYLGNARAKNKNDHFTYKSYYNAVTKHNVIRTLKIHTLNAHDVCDKVEKEFASYKTYHNKGADYSLSNYLQDAGFNCDDWNNEGLYKGQHYNHRGNVMTTEWYQFYIQYTAQSGKGFDGVWGDVKYNVLGSPNPRSWGAKYKLMAFVDTKGILIGSHEEIYKDTGNTVVDQIYALFRDAQNIPTTKGKVW